MPSGFSIKSSCLQRLQKGFSLLEIAIALAIFGFLAYGLASNIKVGRDYDNYKENREMLLDAKQALIAFVQTNGYLPCPDGSTAVDGLEDRSGAECSFTDGRLPYRTIGMLNRDEWGNTLYYATVTNSTSSTDVADSTLMASYFSSISAPVFDLDTPPLNTGAVTGAIRICGEQATTCTSSTPSADMVEEAAVAVIVSFGDNGEYSWNNLGVVSKFGTREAENIDRNNYFWKETATYSESDGFDDQLVWITGFDIKVAMLKSENGLSE